LAQSKVGARAPLFEIGINFDLASSKKKNEKRRKKI